MSEKENQIARSSRYIKQVKRLLAKEEQDAMESHVALNPLAYPVMPRTGGFRKARWSRGNSGRSGGVRVLFYYLVRSNVVFLAEIYPKNEKENITRDEEKELKRIAQTLEG